MKKLFLFLGLALGINQTTQPLSLSNARIFAGVIGVGAASGAFYIAASEQDSCEKKSLFEQYQFPVLSAAASGLVAAGLGYWLLYGYTPEWKFSELKSVVTTIENDPIAKRDFTKTPAIDFIQTQWGRVTYYLVKAKRAAYRLVDRCDYASRLTHKLEQDLPGGVSVDEVTKFVPTIDAAKENALTVAKAALNHKHYATQEAARFAAKRVAKQALTVKFEHECKPGFFVVFKP